MEPINASELLMSLRCAVLKLEALNGKPDSEWSVDFEPTPAARELYDMLDLVHHNITAARDRGIDGEL